LRPAHHPDRDRRGGPLRLPRPGARLRRRPPLRRRRSTRHRLHLQRTRRRHPLPVHLRLPRQRPLRHGGEPGMRSAMNHSSLLRRQAPTAALAAGVLAITLFVHADPASLDLSITVAIFSLLALSVAASYGQAGVLSVAQAAFAALGGYATAIATTRWDLPVLAGLAAAVAVPVLVAYPLARLVSRLSHLAPALATLLLGEIVVILLREGVRLTGRYL